MTVRYPKIYSEFRAKHSCLGEAELREIRNRKSIFHRYFSTNFASYFSDVDRVFFKKFHYITSSPSLTSADINILLQRIEGLPPWHLNLASPYIRDLFQHPSCKINADYYVNHKSLIFRRAIVNYPDLTEEHLTTLASDNDTEVILGALTHPNIGEDVLLKHFKNTSDQYYVLKNKRCPPSLIQFALQRMESNHLLAIVQNAGIDQKTFDNVAKHLGGLEAPLLQSLISNSKTSKSRLMELYERFGEKYLVSFLKNPNCPPEILQQIVDQIFDNIEKDLWLFDGVIFHPNTTPEIVHRLYQWIKEEELHIQDVLKWARSKGVEHKVLIDPKSKLLIVTLLTSVAFSHHVTEDMLIELTDHESGEVRLGVAMNVHTPPHLLEKLAQDSNSHVRNMVALNPSTPQPVLEYLFENYSHSIKRIILTNANIPDSVIRKLALDHEVGMDAIEMINDIDTLLTLRLMNNNSSLTHTILNRINEIRSSSHSQQSDEVSDEIN